MVEIDNIVSGRKLTLVSLSLGQPGCNIIKGNKISDEIKTVKKIPFEMQWSGLTH